MKRRIACLLLALLLLLCAFPTFALEKQEEEQEAQAARERIIKSCEAAKKRSGKKSFKGYCGAYINQLMMVYGINTKYVKGNGNQIFDNYKNLEVTTGGYAIQAYDCKEYTLEEALREIVSQEEIVHNVVIGFTKSPSKSGKKYGHCIFIDTIMGGNVYYSESSKAESSEGGIEAGDPIVRSLEEFVECYQKYKLDGVLYFVLLDEDRLPDLSVEDAVVLEDASELVLIETEEADE